MHEEKRTAPATDPLILTLDMDPENQSRFDDLRKAHFPPGRNWLNAHLTLFHHLPSSEQVIVDVLEQLTPLTSVFHIHATGLMSLGGGVAFRMQDERLSAFHKTLQHRWQQWLTSQDKQKRSFHVTIQNKVAPAAASRLLEQLQPSF